MFILHGTVYFSFPASTTPVSAPPHRSEYLAHAYAIRNIKHT